MHLSRSSVHNECVGGAVPPVMVAPTASRTPHFCEHDHTEASAVSSLPDLVSPGSQRVITSQFRIAASPGPQHVPFAHLHSLGLDEKAPVFSLACYTRHGRDFLVTSSGIQGALDVWDLSFFSRVSSLVGHSRQVTAVAIDSGAGKLYSAARDGIKTWNLETRECVSTVSSYRGTMYCMVAAHGWLFAGGQDTFVHAFSPSGGEQLLRGHSGFVFALCAWDERRFFSAGGNADIFLWEQCEATPVVAGSSATPPTWRIAKQLIGHSGAVLNMALDGEHLYSVSRDGSLKIWDLETLLLTRSLVMKHRSEMVGVAVTSSVIFAASSQGTVSAWAKPSLSFVGSLHTDSSSAVVSLAASGGASQLLFVGGSEGDVGVWQHDTLVELPHCSNSAPVVSLPRTAGGYPTASSAAECLSSMLAQFVAFKTVSGVPALRGDCFHGAKWLRNCFVSLGFDARLEQPADDSVNPIVYARIGDNPALKTVVMYGHYDVVAAGAGWNTDPWVLRGINGFLYGRGATDDKGPLLAAMLAVSQLAASGKLYCNVRFLVEGEEENGSSGVLDSVSRNASYLGPASLLLISNNYWIGEDRPCIIYGLRGVIYFSVTVSGPLRSNHSGVEGGAYREPMADLVQVLATITDPATGRVNVRDFYSEVRPVSEEERALYDDIEFDVDKYSAKTGLAGLLPADQTPTELLMQRWRFPSLSVTGIEAESGANNPTIIPRSATATLSMRTVPDQNHETLVAAFSAHMQEAFERLQSRNTLEVKVTREGQWWLGDLQKNPFFKSTERALEKVWGQKPMYTREGGSIPILSKLESALQARTLILPVGQSLDNAHLPNERVSLMGLVKGMEVFREIFQGN